MFLPKSLGDRGFQEKLPGGPPISIYIAFLLTSVLKFASYLPSPLPPCASMHPTHLAFDQGVKWQPDQKCLHTLAPMT
jgi:hypothetical protein